MTDETLAKFLEEAREGVPAGRRTFVPWVSNPEKYAKPMPRASGGRVTLSEHRTEEQSAWLKKRVLESHHEPREEAKRKIAKEFLELFGVPFNGNN